MNETQTLMSYHLFWRICFLWREQQLLQALSILHAKVSLVCILMGRAVAPKTTFNQYREQNGNFDLSDGLLFSIRQLLNGMDTSAFN
jgi:hypothetical protein